MNKKIFLNSAIILLSVTCFTGSVDALDNSRVIAIPSEIVNSENAYNITLKAKTDGVESDLGGSIVSENGVLSGSNGTKINLKITTNPGYRFVGYQSFLENGNSTDGLLPIENDSFEISDKTGNVTVIAIFESVPVDESIYF
ncbi:TPA: cell surface protein, partial [Streptococcus suis]